MLIEHTFSRWNSYSLNEDIKYSLEISLMGSVIQRVRPNHFIHKYMVNNLKGLNWVHKD